GRSPRPSTASSGLRTQRLAEADANPVGRIVGGEGGHVLPAATLVERDRLGLAVPGLEEQLLRAAGAGGVLELGEDAAGEPEPAMPGVDEQALDLPAVRETAQRPGRGHLGGLTHQREHHHGDILRGGLRRTRRVLAQRGIARSDLRIHRGPERLRPRIVPAGVLPVKGAPVRQGRGLRGGVLGRGHAGTSAPSRAGIEASRRRVYSSRGAANTSATVPDSTTSPPRSTVRVSANWRTTPRSWE